MKLAVSYNARGETLTMFNPGGSDVRVWIAPVSAGAAGEARYFGSS